MGEDHSLLSLETAKELLLQDAKLNMHPFMVERGYEYVIIDSDTIETAYIWAFHVSTRQYLETGDYKHQVIGAGPTIVEKADGSIYRCGGIYSPQTWIRFYEAECRPSIKANAFVLLSLLIDRLKGRTAHSW